MFFLAILTFFTIAEQCAVMSLPSTPPPTPVTTTSTPPGCMWNGQWYAYPEGAEFYPDPCTFCQCLHGEAVCLMAACMMPQCVDAVRDPTQCCPVCPKGENCLAPDGSIIKMGEEVTIDEMTCRCDPSGFLSSERHAVCALP